jgi:hypothetical protein
LRFSRLSFVARFTPARQFGRLLFKSLLQLPAVLRELFDGVAEERQRDALGVGCPFLKASA